VAVPQGGSTVVLHRDRSDGRVLRRLVLGPQHDVRFSAVSPDGRWVVTCSHWTDSRSKSARIWNADTGQKVHELPLELSTQARFSPDGRWLLTIAGGDYRLWEVGTWTEVRRFDERPWGAGGCAFSPDSRLLALDDLFGVIRLVEPATGREVARLTGPEPVRYGPACFTPDGTRLIARCADETALYVWDLRSIRRQLKELGLDWDWPEFPPAAEPVGLPPPGAAPTIRVITAEAEATKAIELKPNDWSSWNQRAWAYFQQQRWDQAVADYSKAIELNPNVHTTWFHRGHAHMALKKWDEVVVDYSELLKRFPGDANAYYYRGWAHENRSRWRQASADYYKAIELAPKNDTAHNRLAWLLATCPDAKVRDPGRAVELARKAVQLEPKQGFYWQTLGYAEYRAGNWESAIAALDKVKALGSPGDSLEWFPLAMAHWQLGHKEEARKWYDQAVAWMDKNQPTNQELRRFRAEAAELLGIEKKKD
jgi:tetratricopeptide (TPR) repeat protein